MLVYFFVFILIYVNYRYSFFVVYLVIIRYFYWFIEYKNRWMNRKCRLVCLGDDFMEECVWNNEKDRELGIDEFVKGLNVKKWDWDIILELRCCFFFWCCFFLLDGKNKFNFYYEWGFIFSK